MSSKSVRDGSIPTWMKNKTEGSINLNDLSAQSPPTHDEPFFHIRLPLVKRAKLPYEQSTSTESNSSLSLETDIECGPSVDLSNECKKYYAGLENATPANFHSSKPKGTDDDFKTAACAGSLVKVAQKFVGGTSGKTLSKRFTVAKIEEYDDHAPPLDDTEDGFANDPHLMQRRNSRSLPTSPLQSPKTMRKFQPQPNPYFTITGSDAPPPKQSWILTSLFGVRRELTTSTMSVSSQIDEVEEMEHTSTATVTATTTTPTQAQSTGLHSTIPSMVNMKKDNGAEQKPQPTMLREMNFWAPTSY